MDPDNRIHSNNCNGIYTFYQHEFSNTNLELSDEEQTITVDYYDDYELVRSSSEDRLGSNESTDWFGGNMQEIKEINDPDDEE